MSVILILVALALLIAGAWAGLSVLVLGPGLAALAALVSGMPMLGAYTQVFMQAAGGFVIAFFPLFLLGTLIGKVMEASGAAQRLAQAISGAVGPSKAILAVVLACALLTYGGVSLFVVAFAVWPLERALFAQTGLPARLIPATIALGAFTFTMTALPGTPSIQNAIPMATFGTTPFAAPGLGLIAGLVMFGLGLVWLRSRAVALAGDTPPDMPDAPARASLASVGGAGPDPFGRCGHTGDGSGYPSAPRYILSGLAALLTDRLVTRGRPVVCDRGSGRGAGLGAYPQPPAQSDGSDKQRR